jgi:tripartite-type tricarboxylate transporter receptor subunit TctC
MLRTALLLAVSGVLTISTALAQTYPSRTVRIMAPFSPGGPVDITARIVAQKLTESLGQTVVVENRAGASGMIGAELVAKSPPDGHMLLANSSIHVIVPSLFSKMTYDPVRDFIPVTVVSSSPLMLVVTPALPVKNIKGFIGLAKARPGDMSFASDCGTAEIRYHHQHDPCPLQGTGTSHHRCHDRADPVHVQQSVGRR